MILRGSFALPCARLAHSLQGNASEREGAPVVRMKCVLIATREQQRKKNLHALRRPFTTLDQSIFFEETPT